MERNFVNGCTPEISKIWEKCFSTYTNCYGTDKLIAEINHKIQILELQKKDSTKQIIEMSNEIRKFASENIQLTKKIEYLESKLGITYHDNSITGINIR